MAFVELGWEALDFAKKISEKPTKSIGLIKSLLNKSNKNSISEQLELEKKYQITAANSTDHKEGVKAFFEKRNPKNLHVTNDHVNKTRAWTKESPKGRPQ